MLINLRNALMTGKRLPYDAELEYLESTGAQYVKLPVRPSSDCDISVDFQVVTFGQGAPFGGGDGNLSNEILVLPRTTTATSTDWIYRCGNKQNQAGLSVSYYDRHTIRWLFNSAYLDGALVSNITAANAFTATRDYMGLFCSLRNGDTSPTFMFKGRIFSCKIYVGGVLVHEYIPVLDWDGNAKMFDRVTQSYPAHYGTFVGGPEIWPVEYIRSVNNTASSYSYIDTGITASKNTKWELCAAFTKPTSVGSSIIGVYGGSDGRFDIGKGSDVWIINRGATTTGGRNDEAWHTFLLDGPNGIGYVDGVAAITLGNTFSYQSVDLEKGTICLFCRGRGDRTPPVDVDNSASLVNMSIASSRIWDANGNLVRDLKAIRVGTGSTWEGAMMDVLTRRIYRNAGTGAFAYGNDLKYPIPSE